VKSYTKFQEIIYNYYQGNKRSFPWRLTTDPYKILVSEIMLQQTQAHRVVPKYRSFLRSFPTIQKLTAASQREVLGAWNGLGYNRRALYLQAIAKTLEQEYGGKVPREVTELIKLPGIGYNTACSIAAFAFDIPVIFIETNIRATYLDYFFKGKNGVDDKQLLPIIAKTLDQNNPRQWYWALMDYGNYLKRNLANPSRRSKHHTLQTRFSGSSRQLRGQLLKLLLTESALRVDELNEKFAFNKARVQEAVTQLVKEGFITQKGDIISLR